MQMGDTGSKRIMAMLYVVGILDCCLADLKEDGRAEGVASL